jgi:hypothetical protein
MGQGCRQRVVHCVVEIRGISESPFEFGKHPNGFGSLLDQRLVLDPVTRRQRINVARLAWAPLVIFSCNAGNALARARPAAWGHHSLKSEGRWKTPSPSPDT